MRLSYIAFVPLLSISAQDPPDATQLLSQRYDALKNYQSYQYVETTTMGRTSSTTTVQAVNPDKAAVIRKGGIPDFGANLRF